MLDINCSNYMNPTYSYLMLLNTVMSVKLYIFKSFLITSKKIPLTIRFFIFLMVVYNTRLFLLHIMTTPTYTNMVKPSRSIFSVFLANWRYYRILSVFLWDYLYCLHLLLYLLLFSTYPSKHIHLLVIY